MNKSRFDPAWAIAVAVFLAFIVANGYAAFLVFPQCKWAAVMLAVECIFPARGILNGPGTVIIRRQS